MAQTAPLAATTAPFPFQEADRPVLDLDAMPRSTAERLAGGGLGTTQTLHAASDVDIVAATGAPIDVIHRWKAMAELLDLAALEPKAVHALARAGVASMAALASWDPTQLHARLSALAAGRPPELSGPEGAKIVRRWVQQAGRHPGSNLPTAAPTRSAGERVVVISTARYWTALLLSLLFLSFAYGSYRDYLPGGSIVLLWITAGLALVVIGWCLVGLSRRGRIVHRTVAGTRSMVRGVGEGIRNRSEAHEGALGRFASKWARRLAKVARAVAWLVLLPIRILVWAWYTGETLVWRVLLVSYDLVYYPLLAAWLVLHWALRTSIRIVWWALGVVWRILKPLTRLPVAKTLWRRRYRPTILARYRAFHHAREHHFAMRVEKGRRLAEMHHRDPSRWEEHFRATHGFPLPHPEHGRVRIRKRIAHIRRAQRARRERVQRRHVPAHTGTSPTTTRPHESAPTVRREPRGNEMERAPSSPPADA